MVSRSPVSEPAWALQQSEWLHLTHAARSRIAHCLNQLSPEQIWWRPFPDGNSVANQILHVGGNLKQWVVDGIAGRESRRNRAAEFSCNGGRTGPELLEELDRMLVDVRRTLLGLTAEMLAETRQIQGFKVTVAGALSHSIPHLVGHTHQIMLLTRLQLREAYQFHWTPDGDRSSVPL